jgi:hypothetical protein
VSHCEHTGLSVVVHWPRRYCPAPHDAVQAVHDASFPAQSLNVPVGQTSHTRSLVGVGGVLSYSPRPHVVMVAQGGGCVDASLQAPRMYCVELQAAAVTHEIHVRSDVDVQGCVANWLPQR